MTEIKILGITVWKSKPTEPDLKPGDTYRYIPSPNILVGDKQARVIVPLREETNER